MATYVVRRLLMGLIVLILVSLMVFLAMRLLPGDPIMMLITETQSKEFTEMQIADLKKQFGLDKPLIMQYFNWVGGVFHGDLGNSIMHRAPVAEEITRRVPITFHLGIIAFVIGFLIGIPTGILSAIRRGTWVDTLVTTLANLGITVPAFWLGLMLIYVFGLYLHWLPVQGYTSPITDFWLNTRQMIMPVICLSLHSIASNTRQTRSSMLEVMRQDYIRTAWSKGLRERMVILRHALKNGLIPVITLSAMGLSIIIGGSVIIETVFNIPGMGRLAVTAIQNQDYPYVQGIVLIISTFIMLLNIIVDLVYGWLDPRIRFS